MKALRRLLGRVRFSGQITALICVLALLPMIVLAGYMLGTTRTMAVENRRQEALLRANQLSTQMEKAAELANMTTQVFLNTPSLLSHLTSLRDGEGVHGAALRQFYDNDIASLEKVVVSNPYLYQIRVYAETDDMSELVPILYSASRMRRMPWASDSAPSGTWRLDFDDQLFPSYAVTPHIMSLVTDVTTQESGKVGTLEVAMRMNGLMPELFAAQEDGGCTVLADLESGGVLVGAALPELSALLGASNLHQTSVQSVSLGDRRVLLMIQPLPAFGCSYVRVESLADIEATMQSRLLVIVLALLLVFAAITVAVSLVTRRMLRQFYSAFDAVRAFSQGDLNASVPATDSVGEVGRFAQGINEMLSRIRMLMQDNVNRELLTMHAELRALQNQINAHFLYNVLEAIKMMAEIDEEYAIADAVTNLGKLLRYSMKWTTASVTVADELENIRNYLALMNLRFDYAISLRSEVPEALLSQAIPKMSLQPIVENAVVHGMEGLDHDTEIILRGVTLEDGEDFVLEVIDHGQGMDDDAVDKLKKQISGEIQLRGTSGNGLGLKNVQDRIRMAFGKPYGLAVSSEQNEFTKVTVYLPCAANAGRACASAGAAEAVGQETQHENRIDR